MDVYSAASHVRKPRWPLRTVLGVLLVVLLVLFAMAAYRVYQQTEPATISLPKPHGTVYFAAASRNTPALNVYRYDFDTDAFAEGSDEFGDPAYLRHGATVSPDGEWLAYFNAVAATATPPGRETSSASTYRLIQFSVTNPETYTMHATSTGGLKAFPEWSPDSRSLLFERYEGGQEGDIDNLDSWGVYLLTEDGSERRLATGASPKWSPDGTSVLYLTPDGIYHYDLTGETSTLVLGILGEARWGWTRMDISADGGLLALSSNASSIELYGITSWEPVSLELRSSVYRPNVRHWWPQFSPDGALIAVIDWEQQSTGNPTPSLGVYATGRPYGVAPLVEAVPLDRFDLAVRYLSDWR